MLRDKNFSLEEVNYFLSFSAVKFTFQGGPKGIFMQLFKENMYIFCIFCTFFACFCSLLLIYIANFELFCCVFSPPWLGGGDPTPPPDCPAASQPAGARHPALMAALADQAMEEGVLAPSPAFVGLVILWVELWNKPQSLSVPTGSILSATGPHKQITPQFKAFQFFQHV